MRKSLLFGAVAISLTITPLTHANKPELSDKEIVVRSDRLDAINEKLQQPMPDKEKADLLCEKAQLMFNTFGQLYLRTSTEALLKAIQISPQKKYEDYLSEAYDSYWKNQDFGEDDQVSKDLTALKRKCEVILGR